MKVTVFDLLFPRVFMYPDTGSSSGGQVGDDDRESNSDSENEENAEVESPKYTEAEFQAQLARNRQREQKKAKKIADQREAEVAKLQERLQEMEQKLAGGKQEGGEEGQKVIKEKKMQDMIEALEKQVSEAQQRQRLAEQRHAESRRDTMLYSTLTEAGCLDLTTGYRYLLPCVERDELEEDESDECAWKLKLPDSGLLVDITEENVQVLLPKFLLNSSTEGGSSAASSAGGAKGRKIREIENLEAELKQIQDAGKRGADQQSITTFLAKKRQLAKLKKELDKK